MNSFLISTTWLALCNLDFHKRLLFERPSHYILFLVVWLIEAVHGKESASKMLTLMGYDSYHFIATEFHGIAGGDV